MQPLMPGVIKEDPAGAYIMGMEDTDATRQGYIRALIEGLVSDGVWNYVDYLGVIQHTENDSLTCLKRREQLFSVVQPPTDVTTGLAPLTFYADSGFEYQTTATGGISSGFVPDSADTAYRDAHGFFTFMSVLNATALGYVHGRLLTTVSSAVRAGYTNANNVVIGDLGATIPTIALALGGSEYFSYLGRDDSNTVRVHRGSNAATSTITRTGSFAWNTASYPDATVHHYGANHTGINQSSGKTAGDRIAAWGGVNVGLNATQVDYIRVRLSTYLNAIGAI